MAIKLHSIFFRDNKNETPAHSSHSAIPLPLSSFPLPNGHIHSACSIQTSSLLQQDLTGHPHVDERQLAHLIADALILQTSLEGESLQETTQFRLKQLKWLKSQFPNIQYQYFEEMLRDFSLNPQEKLLRLSLLETGERLFIQGGWESQPDKGVVGHAMVYELIKNANGTFDLWIYNTGAGLQYHSTQTIGNKTKSQRAYRFCNILPEQLGIYSQTGKLDPFFFVGVQQYKDHSISKGTGKYTDEKAIYGKLFSLFKGHETCLLCTEVPYSTQQRAGTCAQRVLDPIMLKYVCQNDKDLYKQLHFYLNFYATISFFQSHSAKLNDTSLMLLKAACSKLSRTSAKLFEKDLLTSQEMQRSLATLTEVRFKIASIPFAQLISVSRSDYTSKRAAAQLHTSTTQPNSYNSFEYTIPALLTSPLTPQVFLNWLKTFLDTYHTFQYEKFAGIYEIEQYLDAVPAGLIAAMPSACIPELLTDLEELLSKYTAFTSSGTTFYPKRQNYALFLLQLILECAKKYDTTQLQGLAKLAESSLILPLYEASWKEAALVFFHKEDFERRKQLLESLTDPAKFQLFDLEIDPSNPSRAVKDEWQLMNALIDTDPSVAALLEREIEEEIASCKKWGRKLPSRENLRTKFIFAAFTKDEYRDSKTLKHVLSLKRACLLVQSFLLDERNKYSSIYLSVSQDWKGKMTYSQGIAKLCVPEKDEKSWNFAGHEMHEKEKREFWNDLRPLFLHTQVPSESAVMLTSQKFPYAKLMHITNCSPNLQPTKLLAFFKEHISDLNIPDRSSHFSLLFNLLFFKPILYPDSGFQLPLLQELQSSPQLRKACKNFINEGFHLFWKIQPNQKPQIRPCLFFIRLGTFLKMYYPEIDLPDFEEAFHALLESDHSPDDKSNIHLHRLLWIAKLPLNQLDDDAIADALASWFYYNQYPLAPKDQNAFLKEWADRTICSWSPHLALRYPSTTLWNRILTTCLGVPPSQALWKKEEPLVYRQEKGMGAFYRIHLCKGAIYSENGLVQSGTNHLLLQAVEGYSRLFEKKQVHLTKEGEIYSFFDPDYGKLRIVKNCLQREINGFWYEYSDPTKQTHLPFALAADHSHWVAIKDKSPFWIVIASIKRSGELVAAQYFNQEIKTKEKEKVWPSSSEAMETRQFESPDYSLFLTTEDGHRILRFPRYSSTGGSELEFASEPGEKTLHWRSDPAFVLCPWEPLQLGSIPNYLILRKKEKKKLLIPVQPILAQKNFTMTASLDVLDKHRNDPENENDPNGLLKPQQGQYRYLEFDLQGGEILPVNTEGRFYKVYLSLAQRDHETAFRILKALPLESYLSETSQKILRWIWELPKLNFDSSPSSAAVRLYALHLFSTTALNPLFQMELFTDEKDTVKEIMMAHRIYGDGLHYIPHELRWMQPSPPLSTDQCLDIGSTPFHVLSNVQVEAAAGFNDSCICWDPTSLKTPPASLEENFAYFYIQALKITTGEERLIFKSKLHFYPNNNHFITHIIHFALTYPQLAPPIPAEDHRKEWLADYQKRLFINKGVLFGFISKPPQEPELFYNELSSAVVHYSPPSLSKVRAEGTVVPSTLPPLLSYRMAPMKLEEELDRYFIAVLKEQKPVSCNFANVFVPECLTQKAMQHELNEFQKNYEIGRAQAASKKRWHLKTNEMPDLKEKIKIREKRNEKLKSEILTLAHFEPEDESTRLYERALRQGEILPSIEIDQLIDCFHEASGYRSINPYLSVKQMKELDTKMAHYLLGVVELNQAKKASSKIEKLKKHPEEKAILENEIGEILAAKIAYNPSTDDRSFLVFEVRSGLRLRQIQVDLIREMLETDPTTQTYRNLTAQLMMGGGKTTAISSVLLEICAKKAKKMKRLTVFIALNAQFQTLQNLLVKAQKKHFMQEVIPLSLTREQMTAKNLLWLKNKLEEISEKGWVVLTKLESLQALQLEFFSLLYQADQYELTETLSTQIKTLADILKLLNQTGDAIIDEVDAVLAPNKIVNFPVGDPIHLEPMLIDHVAEIIHLHCSQDLKVGAKSVDEILQLQTPRLSQIDIAQYKTEIQPLILKELFCRKREKFQLEEEMFSDFASYVTGVTEVTGVTGQKPSSAFLDLLEQWKKDPNQKAPLSLITLTKGLFAHELLALTINQEENRHFGRSQNGSKVIPYLAADTPAATEFGNPWEAVLYHFRTVAKKGVTEEQVSHLAAYLYEKGRREAVKKKIQLDETEAFREFFGITGMHLYEFQNPSFAKIAAETINLSLEKRFKIETISIGQDVIFYDLLLSSNAQNGVEQTDTRRAFSGTPAFRLPCYHDSLQTLLPEPGVEGRITDRLISTSERIYTFDKANVLDILQQAFSQGLDRHTLFGLIDASGILKDESNQKIAGQIAATLQKDVLFFGKRDKNELTSDHVMVYRHKTKQTQWIGTGNIDDLRKANVNPNHTFVFYDERHCEATDIPQGPHAVNLLTVNETLVARTLFQAALRQRQFFEGQRIALATPKEAQNKMPNGGKTAFDLIAKTVMNEGADKAKETNRSYLQKIENASRQSSLNELLNAQSVKGMVQTFKERKDHFVHQQSLGCPIAQFYSCSTLEPTTKVLETAAEKAMQPPQKEAFLEKVEKEPYLPSHVIRAENALGQEVEIQQQIQVQIEQNIEQELEQELQTELDYYSGFNHAKPYEERSWEEREISSESFPSSHSLVRPLNDFLKSFYPLISATPPLTSTTPPSLFDRIKQIFMRPWRAVQIALHRIGRFFKTLFSKIPLKTVWNRIPSIFTKKFNYEKPYHSLFNDRVLISENLARSASVYLPIFHSSQKLAHQNLCIYKEGKVKVLMLSIHDAAFFKTYLKKHQPNDLWLIHPDGAEISDHPHASLNAEETKVFAEALLQIQLFNGNARYLSSKETEFKAWIQNVDRALISRFLKLKTANDPDQRKIFYEELLTNGELL